MRLYDSCVEMVDETYREIWKRGQTIFDKTVQGKVVGEKDFEQKEIIFYNFRVDKFDDMKQMLDKARDISGKEHMTLEIAEAWFHDMITNESLIERWWSMTDYTKKYYDKFCSENEAGEASYSYGERIIPQIADVIKRLKDNTYSRGALITLTRDYDCERVGRRIPCTVSYHFIARPTLHGDKLNLIVNMRSGDAINFFPLDFAKSVLLLKYIAKKVDIDVGYVIMNIDSLHVYAKDVPDEYRW